MYRPTDCNFESANYPKLMFGNTNYTVVNYSPTEIVVFTLPSWGISNKHIFKDAGFTYKPYYFTNPSRTAKAPGWKITIDSPGMEIINRLKSDCESQPTSPITKNQSYTSKNLLPDCELRPFTLPASKPTFNVFGGSNILAKQSEWQIILPQLLRLANQDVDEVFADFTITNQRTKCEALAETHKILIELASGENKIFVLSKREPKPSVQVESQQ